MPSRVHLAAIIASLALLNAGCTSATSTVVGPTTIAKCQGQVSATATESAFAAGGGRSTIVVNAARDCTWSASADAAWIALDGPRDGQGEATIAYHVTANATPVPRSGAVRLADARVEITQEGAPCRYTLDRSAIEIPAQGGSHVATVSAMTGCAWSAATTVDWVTVTGGHSGNGTAEVRLAVAANGGAARSGRVSIGDQFLTVSQAATPVAAPAPPPPPPPPTPGTPPPPSPPGPAPAPEPIPLAKIDLDGEASQVSGSCPDIRFRVRGLFVVATEATVYKKSSCGDLQNGRRVDVKARIMSDTSIRAEQIEVRRGGDDDDDDD